MRLGLYFIFVRPALLPEDVRYSGGDLQALQAVAPRLGDWLAKVFTVMGGFMSGAGGGMPIAGAVDGPLKDVHADACKSSQSRRFSWLTKSTKLASKPATAAQTPATTVRPPAFKSRTSK
jgi:hypothetical protein